LRGSIVSIPSNVAEGYGREARVFPLPKEVRSILLFITIGRIFEVEV